MKKQSKLIVMMVLALLFLALALLFTPRILEWKAAGEQTGTDLSFKYFPVTVDPANKTITEKDEVNAFLADHSNFEIEPPASDPNTNAAFLMPRGFFQTLPHRDQMDGFFGARFRRRL